MMIQPQNLYDRPASAPEDMGGSPGRASQPWYRRAGVSLVQAITDLTLMKCRIALVPMALLEDQAEARAYRVLLLPLNICRCL